MGVILCLCGRVSRRRKRGGGGEQVQRHPRSGTMLTKFSSCGVYVWLGRAGIRGGGGGGEKVREREGGRKGVVTER